MSQYRCNKKKINMTFSISLNVFIIAITLIILTFGNPDADKCLDHIKKMGINVNDRAINVFQYVYIHIDLNSPKWQTEDTVIGHGYVDYLFISAISDFNYYMICDPLSYCRNNIGSNYHQLMDKQFIDVCIGLIEEAGFAHGSDSFSALRHAYFNMFGGQKINSIAKSYYIYILETFLNNRDFYAKRPLEYCDIDIYPTTDCIRKITNIGKFSKRLNGNQAFEHAYFSLIKHNIIGKEKDVSYFYYEYLYNKFIKVYKDGMIDKPMDWCMSNIQRFRHPPSVMSDVSEEAYCKYNLEFFNFNENTDAMSAVEYVYYNIIGTREMNGVARGYYDYMLKSIKKVYPRSGALGPEGFCNKVYPGNPEQVFDFLQPSSSSISFENFHYYSDHFSDQS